jgi:hypothetical protein
LHRRFQRFGTGVQAGVEVAHLNIAARFGADAVQYRFKFKLKYPASYTFYRHTPPPKSIFRHIPA